ncbi:MAG: hypothetical protein O6941_05410 [Planctomycetota bacterium]|nr:hypothetical protein [Planctomycetota bacterium]
MISIKWWSGGVLGDGITLSRDQWRTVNRRAFVDFLRHPLRVAAFLGVQMVPVLLLTVVGQNAAPLLIGPTGPVNHMTLIVVLAILIWYAAQMVTTLWVWRNIYGPHLRRAMQDVGWEVCIKCGYSLRGLEDVKQCPECGGKHEPMSESSTEAVSDDLREEGPGGDGG